jgi:hypothetical protein
MYSSFAATGLKLGASQKAAKAFMTVFAVKSAGHGSL